MATTKVFRIGPRKVVFREGTTRLTVRSGGGGGGGGASAGGWLKIADIVGQPASGVTVTSKVFDDAAQTILQTGTASGTSIRVTVRSSYPRGNVDGNAFELTESADMGHYEGDVDITFAGGVLLAQSINPEGNLGALDRATITLALPPAITTAIFTGGYPGAPTQTEVKQGDNFSLQVTADKSFDQILIADLNAGDGDGGGGDEIIAVTPGLGPTTVSMTVADRGTTPQLLAARVRVRDSVTGALSANFDTDSAGAVDGTNVLNLNDLYPTIDGVTKGGATGNAFGIAYPVTQTALKDAEQADVTGAATDFDVIAYDDPTTTELTITNPAALESPKQVNRAGGTYNVTTDNYRITATRNANGAVTAVSGVVRIADAIAVLTVTFPGARIRSGVAPGNDTVVTMGFDQQMQTTPSMSPAASRGSFTGAFVDSGNEEDWTATLRVPDADNPTDGSANAWVSPSGTNRAGRVTSVVTANPTYVVGGFTSRTLNYPAFTADSTETFPLTTEGNLSIGVFSNGNPGVVQPFGTADQTMAGREGWWAPNAASGVTTGRMLHTPTVSANSSGITLTLVEETA